MKLFYKRMREELSRSEEREYKRLTRKINAFAMKMWLENADARKSLGRSQFTDAGKMIHIVRRRNAEKLKRRKR